MKRNQLTGVVAAIALGLSTGCASSGLQTAWSKTTSVFRRGDSPTAEAKEPDALASLRKSAKEKEELSEEFRIARKTLKDPESSLLKFAQYQEDLGEYGEARKKYREMLTAYPKNIDAKLGMARIELKTGRSQQAEDILLTLAKEKPDNALVRLELGRMYSKQDDWDKAIQSFQAACDVEPDDQNCRYELGVALAKAGQIDQALAHLTFAVGAPAANYNIGYVLHEQGRDADAVEWFENALQMHPDKATEDRSKSMLAKLMPADQIVEGSTAIAQHSPTGNRSPVLRSQPSTHQKIAHQFAPASVDPESATELPMVAAGGQHEEIALPPVTVGYPKSQSVAQGTAVTTPFRAVSYSESDTAGKASYSASQPAQWHGAAPRTSQPLPPATTAQSPLDPPSWRARQK